MRILATAICVCAGLAGATAGAGAQAPAAEGCSTARMEAAPLTVIDPCTALLRNKDLSAHQRAELLFIRGRAYHRGGSLDLAAEDYDAALELTPDNEELHLARANIDFRRGLDGEALAHIQRAIELNPSSPRVLRAIGAVFSSAGQVEEALRYLSAALRIDPKEPYALLLRSQLYAQKKRFDEALADADALVSVPPDDMNRVGYLDAEGRQRDFHVVALIQRAELYEDLGKYDLAEADLNQAIAYKTTPEALLARGDFLAARPGRQQAALRDLDAVLRTNARDARAHFGRGVALSTLRRFGDAVKAFDSAISSQPSYPAAFRARAQAQRELGKPDAALQDFITALRQDSTLMRQIMPVLAAGGYWPSAEIPSAITGDLRQAILKCMLAGKCN